MPICPFKKLAFLFQLWYHPKLKIILKFKGGLILKRWIAALLCGLLVLGLTACGQSAEQEDADILLHRPYL